MKIRNVCSLLIIMTCLGTLYPGDLTEVYKRGIIKLTPDPHFGKGVEWNSLLFDTFKDLLVTSDGNIFISNSRNHNFYKFSLEGQLLGTYGREGRGPGDLFFPSLKTCLDGKYLVFSEYPENRKISVFDFFGKCTATLRTKANCFEALGLKNGYIAYHSQKSEPETKNVKSTSSISINIINMNTKKEIEFPFGKIYRGYIKAIGNSVITPGQNYLGDIILNRTGDGNLLVGVTNSPVIKIFSTEGKLIKTFQLNIKPIPVTGQYIEKQREAIINELQGSGKNKEIIKIIKKAIEKSDFENLFDEYLPYYKDILIDSEGNFLVFKWLDSTGKSNEIFQVYSPEGKYICETILDKGKYDIDVARNFQHMQFTNSAFYGIVKSEYDEDIIRLIKVKF